MRRGPVTLVMGLALLAPGSIEAAALSYFQGDVWGVTQYQPEGEDVEAGRKPFCALNTRAWPNKGLSFLRVLTGVDTIEPRLGIYSEGWQLPIGRKTSVSLISWAGTMKFEVEATDTGYLAGSLDPRKIGAEQDKQLAISMNLIFNTRSNGMPVAVKFAGNEPQWIIPSTQPVEAYTVTSAFRRCVTDLTQKSSSFYPAAASAEGGAATSPFDESDDTASASSAAASDPLAAPATPTVQAATEWRFDTAEEEGSTICFAATETKGIEVGFMAAPGKDVIGFVKGLFSGQVTTTWRVDNMAPHITDGVEDAYFGWHRFDQVSEALLADVARGNELRIAKLAGKRLVVPLQGAKQALSSFAECVGRLKPASSAESSQNDPQPANKRDRSCLLEIRGQKVIDGPCSWEPYGSDRSALQMTANGYFAILMMQDADNAIGYWNETVNSVHAHAELGKLSRSGDCWANENVRMCPRR